MRAMTTWVVAGVLAWSAAATAVEVAGVRVDDKASVGGQDLVLNGAGLRTKVFFKVYVAGLYVPAKAGSLAAVLEKAPRRVQLTLMRDVSAEEFVEALVDGIKANTTAAEFAGSRPESTS